jgi:phosphatidylserine/phosphatidylglycerophosphate/cardiolipin synthase-like enzyme
MNWTSAGEYENDENTIIIRSPELAAQYTEYFERIWASIPERWLTANPDPESRDSTSACTDGSDNDFDELADDDDPGCGPNPPALPELPPWRKVPKDGRMTCEVEM